MTTQTWDGVDRRGKKTLASKISHLLGHKFIIEVLRGVLIIVGAAFIYWSIGQARAYLPDPDAQARIPTTIWVEKVNAHMSDQRQLQADDKVDKETLRQGIAGLTVGMAEVKRDVSWLVRAEEARQLGHKAPPHQP
jgi:hypothetical protein